MSLIGDNTIEEINLRQMIRHMLGKDVGGLRSRSFTKSEVAAIVNDELKGLSNERTARKNKQSEIDSPSAPA